MTGNGLVSISKSILDLMHWKAGMEFTVQARRDGVMIRPVGQFARTTLDEVVGCLAYSGPAKTLEEMDRGIARLLKERHGRVRLPLRD